MGRSKPMANKSFKRKLRSSKLKQHNINTSTQTEDPCSEQETDFEQFKEEFLKFTQKLSEAKSSASPEQMEIEDIEFTTCISCGLYKIKGDTLYCQCHGD